MYKSKGRILILVLLIIGLTLTACENKDDISLEDILNENIAEEIITNYYLEEEMTIEYLDIYGKDLNLLSKSWVKDGKYIGETRSEEVDDLIEYHDGDKSIMYNIDENIAEEMSGVSDRVFVKNNLEDTKGLLKSYIDDGYEFSEEGYEKIGDFNTLCIKGESKEYGDSIKINIDRDSFLVVKSIFRTDNSIQTSIVKEFNTDITIDDDKFILDFPEDVKYISLDEREIEDKNKELSLEELSKDILYLPEDENIKRSQLEYDTPSGKIESELDIRQMYVKDGKEYICIISSSEEMVHKTNEDGYLIDIDDKKVYIWNDMDMFNFNHKGINYMISFYVNGSTEEDIVDIVKSLETNE